MPSRLFHLNPLDSTIPVEGVSGWFSLLQCFREISVLNANSEDPDQTPHSGRLIRVCTVCQRPFYGTVGLNGLTFRTLLADSLNNKLMTFFSFSQTINFDDISCKLFS